MATAISTDAIFILLNQIFSLPPICRREANLRRICLTGCAQFFMDKTTLKRKADTVQVWELVNMEKVDGEGVRSIRFLVEYDCKGKRSRGLDMLTYTEPMGGKQIQQLGPDPDGWEALPPDSIFSQRMQLACGK